MKRLFLQPLAVASVTLLFAAACEPSTPPVRKRPVYVPPPMHEPEPTGDQPDEPRHPDTETRPEPKPEHVDNQPTEPTPTQPKVGNYDYGKAVPGKPGFVTSPYAPYAGYVDVRGFPPGTEVKDPYTGKVFLVP